MALLEPDRYFSRISFIDVEADLLARGLSGVLVDVDNTVLSRHDSLVPTDVRVWLRRATQAGVSICLLSNNWHSHIPVLAEELRLPVVTKACKPLPHGYILAARKLGLAHSRIVMIGDQISTDVLGAHLVGMSAYLVCPLVEEDLPHTLFLRNIERAFVQGREPEGASACETLRS